MKSKILKIKKQIAFQLLSIKKEVILLKELMKEKLIKNQIKLILKEELVFILNRQLKFNKKKIPKVTQQKQQPLINQKQQMLKKLIHLREKKLQI